MAKMISDMLEACRLCMCREQDTMKPIFDQQGLAAKIIWISDLKVYEGDNLPAQICQQCYVRLNSAYYFKEQVIGIDRTLREMLEQVLTSPVKSTKTTTTSNSKGKANQKPRSSKQVNHFQNVEENISETECYDASNYDNEELQEVKIEVTEHAVIEVDSEEELPAVVRLPAVGVKKRKPHPKNRRRDRNFLIVNNKPRPNKCIVCPKAFITKAHLTRHMLVHAAGKPVRAYKRTYVRPQESLNNTFQTNTSYEDNTNSLDFTEDSSIGTPLSVDLENSFDKVQQIAGVPTGDGSTVISCPICHKIISHRNKLPVHMRIHTGEKPYSCMKCSRRFADGGNRTKHQRICTGQQDPNKTVAPTLPVKNVTPESLPPNYSPTTRLSKKVLSRMAKGGNTADCPHCDAKYTSKSTLSRHILALHSGRPPKTYPCALCTKVFSTNGNRMKHIRMFHGIDNTSDFSCGICEVMLGSKAALVWHMKEHVGEQPYVCTICDKAFVLVHSFNEHIANHARDKPFKCDVCSKTFYENGLLVRHMRIVHDLWPEETLGTGDTEPKVELQIDENEIMTHSLENGDESLENGNMTMENPDEVVTEQADAICAESMDAACEESTDAALITDTDKVADQSEIPAPELVLLPEGGPAILIPKVESVESLMVNESENTMDVE